MSIQEEDAPLDPTLERVRRKMLRLMVISIGIMMIGLMAVLFAIVYKISSPEGSSRSAAGEEPILIELPNGAEVLSTSLYGERMLVETKLANGDRELIVLNADAGSIISRVVLSSK